MKRHGSIERGTRCRRLVRRIAAGVLGLLSLPALAWGQALVPDEVDPAGGRTPLVLIHGSCDGSDVWMREGGLASFARTTPALADRFALYRFEYPLASDGGVVSDRDCADDRTPERVGALAGALVAALAAEPAIGPEAEVAIVAHSTGGLIARSFVQEHGQSHRTRVVVTLATPHLGTLGWDGHDEHGDWLGCLNGAPAAEGTCEGGDLRSRASAFERLVTIGLVGPGTLSEATPHDGVVSLDSALFAGAAPDVRRRYRGLGGQEGGSACWSDASAHRALTHEDCWVEAPDGAQLPVFDAIAQELIAGDRRDDSGRAMAELIFSPDLVVSALGSPPTSIQPGQSFNVSTTTRNAGLASSVSSSTRFYLSLNQSKGAGDRRLLAVHAVPVLAAGAPSTKNMSLVVPANMPLGTYYLLACADDTKKNAESDETNNCRSSATTTTVTRPNLRVQGASHSITAVAPGDTFQITDTTKNSGLVTSAPSKTRYHLSMDGVKNTGDKLLAGARTVPALASDQPNTGNVTVTVPAATPTGWYFVLACADDQNDNVETDESDNCFAIAPQIYVGKPNLIVTFVSNPPLVGHPGHSFYLTMVTVYNASSSPAGESTLKFYLSDDPVKGVGDKLLTGEVFVPARNPNTSYSPPSGAAPIIPANTPLGTYYLIACADATNAVTETDEADNCLAANTTINVSRPDLVVSQVSTAATTATPGTVIEVTDTTANQGLAYAGESTTRYYLSLDQAKSVSDKLLTGSRLVPLLYGGDASTGTVSVTIPANTTPGVYWLLGCADSGTNIVELSETNNCTASPSQITVTPL